MLEKQAEADRRAAVCLMADSAGRVLARDFSDSTLADSVLLEKMSSAQAEALATVCRTKLAAGIEPTELEKQAFVGSLSGSLAVGKHMMRGAGRGWGEGFKLTTKLRNMLGGASKARTSAVKAVERGERQALDAGLSRSAWKNVSPVTKTPMVASPARVPHARPPAKAPAAPASSAKPPAAPAAAAKEAPTPLMQGTLGAGARGAGWGGLGGAGVGAAGGAAVGAGTAEEGHRLRGALVGGALGATGGAALGATGGAAIGMGRQMSRNAAGAAAKGGQQAGQQAAQKGTQQAAQATEAAVPQNLSTEVAGDVAKKGLSPMHYGLGALGLGAAGTGAYFAGRGYLNRRKQLQQGVQQYPQPMMAPPAHYS